MKTQIVRSCFKFLKRKGSVKNYEDFHNLYCTENEGSIISFDQLEHYLCSPNSSKYRTPRPEVVQWCQQKLDTHDSDLAQHFTLGDGWLTDAVETFIKEHNYNGILDPFAGNCSLKTTLQKVGVNNFIGYDIDPNMIKGRVALNDSLVEIPKTGRLIVTNPPYEARCTATRYGSRFSKYFIGNNEDDIYIIALRKCLENHDHVVAIIPETFLLKKLFLDRLSMIVIIEKKLFGKTTCPVLVACF